MADKRLPPIQRWENTKNGMVTEIGGEYVTHEDHLRHSAESLALHMIHFERYVEAMEVSISTLATNIKIIGFGDLNERQIELVETDISTAEGLINEHL